jgi:proline iminopeptidase/L-proline amide hydrolase
MPLEISRRRLIGTAGAALVAAHAPRSLLAQSPMARRDPRAGAFAPDRELMVPVEGGRIYVRINGDLTAPARPC